MWSLHKKIPKLYQLIFLVHFFLTAIVSSRYKGSLLYLFFFSVSFCLLFSLTIRARHRSTAFFLGIMLWLGLWLKFIAHHLVYYPYVDYFGSFRGFPAEWDLVLLISGTAALGYSLSLTYSAGVKSNFLNCPLKVEKRFSFSFKSWFLFSFLAFSIAIVAFLNTYLGLTLSGINAQMKLPFKLIAISGWSLYIGFAILISFFAKYEFAKTGRLKFSYVLIFWEGILSSFSVLSRGLFVFHAIPMLYIAIFYYTEPKVRFKKAFILGTIFSILFVLNSTAVNAIRTRLYENDILKTESYSASIMLNGETYSKAAPAQTFSQIGRLIVDRWIGLEGVMSVSTYPDKDYKLLITTLFNKLKPGELDVYSKMSQYEYNPAIVYNFMCLPGIVAFLYYSNSLIFVFLMMAFLGLLLSGIDNLLHRFFVNPFLSSLVGFYIANGMAQFGVSPRPLFISFFMTISALFFIFIAERYYKKTLMRFY
jgi:hypothetical protein